MRGSIGYVDQDACLATPVQERNLGKTSDYVFGMIITALGNDSRNTGFKMFRRHELFDDIRGQVVVGGFEVAVPDEGGTQLGLRVQGPQPVQNLYHCVFGAINCTRKISPG